MLEGLIKLLAVIAAGFFCLMSIYFQRQILQLKDRIKKLEPKEGEGY